MSKSIWHRYDEVPRNQDIIMTDTGCWAYRADLMSLETELERTRKALEIAVDALKWIAETFNLGVQYETPIVEKCEIALEQITALEQKE